jgi:GDPmannose 4,6-dehydratase
MILSIAMNKVLITGAHGQDGIILSKILLKKKYKVFGVIKKKRVKINLPEVTYFVNDLLNYSKTLNLIKKIKPNIIIHFASNNYPFSKEKKINYKNHYLENFVGTKNLIESVKKNKKTYFVLAGSSRMFGKHTIGYVTEESQFKRTGFYESYKIDAHKLLMKYKYKYSFKATTVIFFNHDSIYRNNYFIIPKLVNSFIHKKYFFLKKIYNFNITGDFSHAEDICYAIYLLIKSMKNMDKIILSSGKKTKINDIILYLAKIFNLQNIKFQKTQRQKATMIGINSLAVKLLKWSPKKTVYDVVYEMILKK